MNEMFCTCIIPTVGRETLSRAVNSVLSQTLTEADFEIVIVNDSGKPLVPTWEASNKIRLIETNRRERSVARNTGASLARGRFLHFLDDDDWIAVDAYGHFWELSLHTDAAWLYGNTQLLDRQLNPTIVLAHGLQGNQMLAVMAGEWIPLQASLIERKSFLEAGGFNPRLMGPEDIDLLRRILLKKDLAQTHNLTAFVVLGTEGSTTDYDLHPHQSRRAREEILDSEDVFKRMQATAGDAFWQARLLRLYLTSALWNLQNRRVSTALSRAMHSIAALLVAGGNIFQPDFWSSVSKSYASPTFARGIQLIDKAGQT